MGGFCLHRGICELCLLSSLCIWFQFWLAENGIFDIDSGTNSLDIFIKILVVFLLNLLIWTMYFHEMYGDYLWCILFWQINVYGSRSGPNIAVHRMKWSMEITLDGDRCQFNYKQQFTVQIKKATFHNI